MTTAAPTTLLTTLAPTTTLTTLAPTTDPDTTIECAPIEIHVFPICSRGSTPAAVRNTELDVVFYSDPISLSLSMGGEMLSTTLLDNVVPLVVTIRGLLVRPVELSAGAIEIELELAGSVNLAGFENWVAWSKIGYLWFCLDETNEAGRMPMDWRGKVFEIYKLGKLSAVVYGANGVTVLVPHEISYEKNTIHRIGVVCKESVIGNEQEHFFIDKSYKLHRLTEKGLEVLDYSEYLSELSSPRLSLDMLNRILYIADDSKGYVYGIDSKSFGEGPRGITGFGTVNGEAYAVSPRAIDVPKFDICTDIYDLGTRKAKTIDRIEVGTDLTDDLKAMVESRVSNKESFIESNWVLVNPNGIAIIPSFGVEFKFHLRSMMKEYLEIDYIKVHGQIHEFEYESVA